MEHLRSIDEVVNLLHKVVQEYNLKGVFIVNERLKVKINCINNKIRKIKAGKRIERQIKIMSEKYVYCK